MTWEQPLLRAGRERSIEGLLFPSNQACLPFATTFNRAIKRIQALDGRSYASLTRLRSGRVLGE